MDWLPFVWTAYVVVDQFQYWWALFELRHLPRWIVVTFGLALLLAEDLWEIRAQHGGDTFRILGFFDGPQLVILVSAFAKKSQKTPKQEIARAEERKRDYLSRKGAHE